MIYGVTGTRDSSDWKMVSRCSIMYTETWASQSYSVGCTTVGLERPVSLEDDELTLADEERLASEKDST